MFYAMTNLEVIAYIATFGVPSVSVKIYRNILCIGHRNADRKGFIINAATIFLKFIFDSLDSLAAPFKTVSKRL